MAFEVFGTSELAAQKREADQLQETQEAMKHLAQQQQSQEPKK